MGGMGNGLQGGLGASHGRDAVVRDFRRRPGRDTRASLAGLAVVVGTLLTACGGGGSETPSSSPSTRPSTASASAAADGTRPEGNWTLVAWTTSRTDITVDQFTARTILGSFEPSCPSGPCALTLSPAGANGTYREPEAPPSKDATPPTQSIELAFDGKTYTGALPSRVVSCTTKDGTSVPKGYSVKTAYAFTFVPASGATPPRLQGTITYENSSTPAGKGKGCTPFGETEAVGGVPTGSLSADTAPSGRYEGTLSTTASTPTRLAPVGTTLWLGPITVAGSGAATTIEGLTKSKGPLALAGGGWSAEPAAGTMDCSAADGSVSTEGAEGTETFTGLHAVALTADARPVFVGGYRLRAEPNATGRKASCSLAVWEGRILLVPQGAGR